MERLDQKSSALFRSLALLALLVVALLPAGLLPRVAGRCGRALCECRPEAHAETAAKDCHAAPLRVLTFGEKGLNSAPVQFAFQLVLTGIETQPIAAPQFESELLNALATSTPFALLEISPQTAIPPPKA